MKSTLPGGTCRPFPADPADPSITTEQVGVGINLSVNTSSAPEEVTDSDPMAFRGRATYHNISDSYNTCAQNEYFHIYEESESMPTNVHEHVQQNPFQNDEAEADEDIFKQPLEYSCKLSDHYTKADTPHLEVYESLQLWKRGQAHANNESQKESERRASAEYTSLSAPEQGTYTKFVDNEDLDICQ